ncbi:hypothetical protein [Baekduia sp. Peel2402]|uniref:hypothetical protein n=1 Tax=Baekduia sp. Peel2402 TaxID=3458296 RepID=UPI00403EA0E7
MTERDAFGNPIEPTSPSTTPASSATPLAGIPASPAGPTAAPTPATPEPTPIAFGTAIPTIPTIPTYGPSKTSWGARFVGLAVFLLFAAPLAIGGYVAYNAFHTAKDAVDGVVIKSRGLTSGLTPTTTTAGTPKASANVSLLHASTLRTALAAAQRDPGGRLTLLRVAPDRADLQLARKSGGLTLVQIRADGGRNVIEAPGTPSKTIGFARVDVKAPSRLVRQAAKRLGRSTKSIDYVVLANFAGSGPQWSAYFKGGAAFSGDAHGRITRRIQ